MLARRDHERWLIQRRFRASVSDIMDANLVGPSLMLGFGLLGGGFGVREAIRLRENPEPLVLPCDAAAIDGAPHDRWVVVESCAVRLEDTVVITRDHDPIALLVPMFQVDASDDAAPVAALYVDDVGVMKAFEEVEAAPSDDAAIITFASKLDPSRVEGTISDRHGADDDRLGTPLRDRYPLASAGIVAIDRGGIPQRSSMITAFIAAIVLLPLGTVYLRRARRQPARATVPLPPGLPR